MSASQTRRRKRRRVTRALWWAALFLLAAAAPGIAYFFSPFYGGLGASSRETEARAAPARQAFRMMATAPASSAGPVLPYSVIPGGVHSEKRLAKVLANDPLVAAHYAGFQLRKFRMIRLRRGRTAYVSYLLDDHIYWTSKKIALFAGEWLFTDGTIIGRARCGNQVSEAARLPTSPSQPSVRILEMPALPVSLTTLQLPPLTNFSFQMQPTGVAPGDSSDGIPFFPVVFLPPGGGTGSGTPILPAPPAPEPTPEPGTLALFSAGLVAFGLRYLWRKKRA